MFPIKMKMNCNSRSPVVALLLSLNLSHTDRSLSTKGCSSPAALQPKHDIPPRELGVLYTRATKLCRAEEAQID